MKQIHGIVRGQPPVLDLDSERALQALLVSLAEAKLLRSAHDCSDGGIAVAIAECCFENGGMGAVASIDAKHISRVESIDLAAALFSESASRAVVSVAPQNVAKVLERAAKAGVAVRMIGRVGGSRIQIAVAGTTAIDVSLADAERVWSSAIERYFAKRVA